MNKNNTYKQCFSLSKLLFASALLIAFSCANATLTSSVAVAAPQAMQTYRIQPGDTLWGIANQFRQDSTVSVEQMMLALLKENPEAFAQGNIHGIKLGYVLRLPGSDSIKRIDKQQAKADVKQHAVLWREYQMLVSHLPPAASMEPKEARSSGGGLSSGRLSLVGGSDDKAALPTQVKVKEITALRDQLTSMHESIEAEKHEKKALQGRLIELENAVDQIVAEQPAEETLIQYSEAASAQSAAKEHVSDTQAEEVMLEEAPMIEAEESQPIGSSSVEPTGEEQPLVEESVVNTFDKYSVVLKADKKIVMPGLPGSLTVWIGDEDYKPSVSDDKAHDEAVIAAVGHYTVIEPFSTAFDFEPVKSDCIKIHSTGSEEHFELTPKDKGVFEVGVKVNLYDSEDCSSPPVPKSSSILEVTVEVDNKEIVFEKLKELWDVFWEQLLEFWGAFIAVTFGLLIFLYKNKLKTLFKFDSDKP